MLGLSKSLTNRFLVPASTQVCSVRHKSKTAKSKTVEIYTMAPPVPVTNTTMGPYPRTKEERERAAKKYNLIPEDYEPYEEEEGWGDYPKLPAIGAYNKYKYDDFDDTVSYRFYGEPFHLNHDLYTWERIDPLESKKIPPLIPYWKRFLWFAGAALFVPTVLFVGDVLKLNINHQYKIRQYSPERFSFPPSPNDEVHHHHH